MIYFIVTLVFIGALEFFHFQERQKLLDRIQAKDFPEYKAFENKPKKEEKKEVKERYEYI